MNPEKLLFPVLIGIAAFLFLFYISRELWCWYFKINDRLDLLKEIKELMKSQDKNNSQ